MSDIFDKYEHEFFQNENSDVLVLVMHGSRGRFNHNLQHNLFLELKEKFSVFNFNFPGEISMLTMDFEIKCIEELVNYFSQKYEKIVLIGHSKSGSEILCLPKRVLDKCYKFVLIAPRIDLMNSQEVILWEKNKENEYFYPSSSVKQLITKEYMNSVFSKCERILEFDYPDKEFLLVYGLDDSVMTSENYQDFIENKDNFEFIEFKYSDHIFSNDEKREDMINYVKNWI